MMLYTREMQTQYSLEYQSCPCVKAEEHYCCVRPWWQIRQGLEDPH